MHIRLPAEDRQKYGEDKVGRLIKSMYGTRDASPIWQLDCVTLIGGDLGGFRRGNDKAALFHNSKEAVGMAVHGDDCCVCRTNMESISSTNFSDPNTQRQTWELWDVEGSDVKSLLLLDRVFYILGQIKLDSI